MSYNETIKVTLEIVDRHKCPFQKNELPSGDGVWWETSCSKKRMKCPSADMSGGYRIAAKGFPDGCPLVELHKEQNSNE